MAVKQMSATAVARFVSSMEEQGVGVTKIKKGLLLRLPDGESTTMHFTNSDVRAKDNLIARLRRAGVRHPDDPRNVADLPAAITEATVSKRSKDKVLKAVAELDYPATVRIPRIRELTGLEHITASRTLYSMGFIPVVGKRNARDWITPEDILTLKPEPEPEPESPDFPEPVVLDREVVAPVEAAPASAPAVREFIDTHDSWVVDLTKLPRTMMIGDYLDSLLANGLDHEIRVWRA